MQLLGYDIGSSSIKACLLDADSKKVIAQATSPSTELEIKSPNPGWAEQNPEVWWEHIQRVTQKLLQSNGADPNVIKGIGIAYQMHGLVLVDKNHEILRPAIIWCDGRAVEIGKKAFKDLGREYCLERFLNSPGNFTASKLKWVKENEPDIFDKIHKAMLPGDYIAMKLTGDILTSISGFSEGIFWDYQDQQVSQKLLEYFDIPASLLPDYKPNLAISGELNKAAADKLGLPPGIPVGYRSGDQPNNALSLNVLDPGEVAANAGTSGVIYGVTDQPIYDKKSRVNTFVHVNHNKNHPRYGVLLCVNGTGIQNSWLKNQLLEGLSYDDMNDLAADVPVGSKGLRVLPFGNGPERVLQNREIGGQIRNLDFNRHNKSHLIRAAQEGIAFSLSYGLKIMKQMGMDIDTVRVGSENMFQSPVFREAFANTSGIEVEVYSTNGAMGAAIGAGLGTGIFEQREDAFEGLNKIMTVHPDSELESAYEAAYNQWEGTLQKTLT